LSAAAHVHTANNMTNTGLGTRSLAVKRDVVRGLLLRKDNEARGIQMRGGAEQSGAPPIRTSLRL
jgi:hypothetical protein